VRAKEPGSQSMNLSGIALFEDLNEGARRELAARGIVCSFQPGDALWRAGGAATAMHVVLSGEVRVVKVTGGRQRVMHTEGRGGTLGDVALFSAAGYPATALAVTPVTTVALTADTLHAVMAADPRFAFHLLARLAGRVRHVIEMVDRMTAWSVQARVAQFLVDRRAVTGSDVFTLGMTQQQLAEELGTVREVVVRTLSDLKAGGHIESAGKGRYRLREAGVLSELARPTSY